jgi:hypothetical protein
MPFVSSVRGSYGSQGKQKVQTGRIGLGTTGGTITTAGGYRIHTFTAVGTSTFTSDEAGNVEYLLVAGGGGGGGRRAGGGGAGGVLYSSSFIIGFGNNTVVVGAGGTAGGSSLSGGRGVNSTFGSINAFGGMGGACADATAAAIGGAPNYTTTSCNSGSGGGRTGDWIGGGSFYGGTKHNYGCLAQQGYNGGDGVQSPWGGAGGGGASQNGANNNGENGGVGGNGIAYSISGSSVTYAGGGAGGGWDPASIQPSGGSGGGGRGGGGSTNFPASEGRQGLPGTNGLGGGGGGNGSGNPTTSINTGGSGIVIIRYPI